MSPGRRRSRLKPHEGDQEAAEADEEVTEAKDGSDCCDRDHIREELELCGRPQGDMEPIIWRRRPDRRDRGSVIGHP